MRNLPDPSHLDNLVVVLVRPRNPLNIGAAARAMSNFGAHRLRLVNPYAVAFREARSAVGALHLLSEAQEFKTIAEAVADCVLVIGTTAVRNRILHQPLMRLNQDSESIRSQLLSGRVALLFGSEKIGLTNEDFTHCHRLLHIPTRPDHISMNLAQSVVVCLYELARTDGPQVQETEIDPATAGANEQITDGLLEALHASGYVKPGNDAMCEKKIRRLVLRFKLSALDAKVLLGMVRQIVWKLRQQEKG